MTAPANWRRTGALPVIVDGYEFLTYRTGIQRFVRYCEAIDATIYDVYHRVGYYATVAGTDLLSPRTGKSHRFTTKRGAMEAVIRAAKGSEK